VKEVPGTMGDRVNPVPGGVNGDTQPIDFGNRLVRKISGSPLSVGSASET